MLDFWFTSYIFTGLFPLKKRVSGWRHEDCRRMCLASYSWILPVLAVAFVDLLAIWWLIKQLQLREPYASVIELGTRQKLRFFRFVPTDRRAPLVVKLIPFPVAAYLANPIDLIGFPARSGLSGRCGNRDRRTRPDRKNDPIRTGIGTDRPGENRIRSGVKIDFANRRSATTSATFSHGEKVRLGGVLVPETKSPLKPCSLASKSHRNPTFTMRSGRKRAI